MITPGNRIALAVQAVPSRADLLPRLRDAVGLGWSGMSVVLGDQELRNPWTTYRACLGYAARAVEFGAASHLLIIQDDALPVQDFHQRVQAAVDQRPGELICLYVPELPTYMGRAMHVAHAKGEPFATIPGGMFTPLVAAVWPVWLALDCLTWADTTPSSVSRRCDDAQVARFLRARRLRPVGVVPSLVEHDELVPSTLGLGRYKRTAAILG